MANAFLIVGVGGAGRGVCNHIKYELEQEFGSSPAAMTRVLVIDGPPSPSQYALPGDPWFEIDTNPHSPEFCQTRDAANPATVIRNIAGGTIGQNEKYVAQWLTSDEAQKIPTTTIQPEVGFGGHRTPGHVYFYLDTNYINTALQRAYNDTRNMLGDGGGQAIVCLTGSQSGGTGSGMLLDVAHLLRRMIAPNNDVLLIFLPLANSYHTIYSTQADKDEVDAKNFAGLLNLIRFNNADMEFLSVIPYAPSFLIQNANIPDIPFVLDGDVTGSKINNVVPQLGVVPAIADFLLSCIKDDCSTGQMANVYTNWTNGVIGVAPKPEKYATFGTYSIRYPYKDVLKSFSYRFAYEIYNDILHPTGENFRKGQTEADRILTGTTFTQMLSDFEAVKLNPESDWRAMRGQIRVGKTGDSPAPPLSPLTEVIKYGRKFIFFGTPDATVIQNTEQYSGNVKTQFDNWLKKQQPKINTAFMTDVEEELVAIFTKIEDGNRVPKTLQDDPSSIVVARDLLKHLKDKFIDFEKYLADKFNEYFYPEGQGRPDIIARQQTVVEEKRLIMEQDSGDVAENQEAYLREATKLLEYDVWEILFKGIQAITTELKEGVLRLWNLIGDDANGWGNRLTEFLERMDDEYDDDITRRNELAQFRLRDYLPTPNGKAEEALFDDIAEPQIQSLLAQMHWDFAINPEDPLS
ncbi:hypothetical protein H8E77_25455 [bacterium]|nr:hypothetical protein [bacterium]